MTGASVDLSADQPGPLSDQITVVLTRGQLLSLARLVRVAHSRKVRLHRKDAGFVPEPGRRDSNLVAIARYERLAATLLAAVGPGYNLADGGRPSRRNQGADDAPR